MSARVGLPNEEPLRWADQDGDAVRDALLAVGGLQTEDLVRVSGATAASLRLGFETAASRVALHHNEGREAEVLVYYVGHAGDGGLHLHGESVSLEALKGSARSVGGERLLVAVDACQSGQLFRTQGARLVERSSPRVDFVPPAGEAWISSSGAEQWSFEADQRRGALFTHFFVTALLGGADTDSDGAVTVREVAAFTRDQSAAVAATFGQLQEPQVAGDLDALVLAKPGEASSGLHIVGPISAPVLVVSRDRCEGACQVVAEVPVGAGASIALSPGNWQLVSEDSRLGLRAVDVRLAPDDWRAVDPSEVMVASRGVRSLGGLVVVRPRVAALSYSLGTLPELPAAHGLSLGLQQAVGRGHHIGGVVSGEVSVFKNAIAAGEASRLLVGGEWRYDLLDARVRLSPGVRVGGGYVVERAARVPTEAWGEWYGARDAAVHLRLPEGHARAQLTFATGDPRWGLQITAGWGMERLGTLTTTMSALEIGLRRPLRGGER